jgi:hypothetical protein
MAGAFFSIARKPVMSFTASDVRFMLGDGALFISHFGAKFEPDTVTSSPTPPPLTARRLAPG